MEPTQFAFDIPDGSTGDARRDTGEAVPAIRFGFLSASPTAGPVPTGDPDLARLLARGVFGKEEAIRSQNIERHHAHCPICRAKVLIRLDGTTHPLLTVEEEDRTMRQLRAESDAESTVPAEGELWITVAGDRILVAPMLVAHHIDYHGYRPPARVVELLLAKPGPQASRPQPD